MNIQEIHARITAVRDGQIARLIAECLRGGGDEHDAETWLAENAELEALFPQAAEVLGWDWAVMTAPGRLRYSTTNMTETVLKALTDKMEG